MDSSSGQKNSELYKRVAKPIDLCFKMESMAIRTKAMDTCEQYPTKFRTARTHKMKFVSRNQAIFHEKPPYSYATMIGFAIISSNKFHLTLREIFNSISKKYPYYKLSERGWQNSVRHNLALNKRFFKKVGAQSNSSKSCYWTITSSFTKALLEMHEIKAKL